MVKIEKEKENKKTKQNKNKQTNIKGKVEKDIQNNPGGRALTLSGTPWCDDNSRKKVQKQLVSGKIEKSLAVLF